MLALYTQGRREGVGGVKSAEKFVCLIKNAVVKRQTIFSRHLEQISQARVRTVCQIKRDQVYSFKKKF